MYCDIKFEVFELLICQVLTDRKHAMLYSLFSQPKETALNETGRCRGPFRISSAFACN